MGLVAKRETSLTGLFDQFASIPDPKKIKEKDKISKDKDKKDQPTDKK